MGMMVMAKQNLFFFNGAQPERLQLLQYEAFLKNLFLDPNRYGLDERAEAPWRECQIGFQKPVKGQQRLVVKSDVIDVIERQSALVQAIGGGQAGKFGVMLDPVEALFLRSRDNLAVLDQGGGAVVVKCGYAENVH